MNGRIVHFEIPFDDGDRAKKFYGDVFGWSTQDMPEMDYTFAMTGPVGEGGMPEEPGFINGGMFKRTDEVPLPVLTINVDSIDDTRAKIESQGGKSVGDKMTVGEMGFAAYFNDSEGNLVGLWENAGGWHALEGDLGGRGTGNGALAAGSANGALAAQFGERGDVTSSAVGVVGELAAALQGAAEGQLVGVLEVAADG